MPPQLAAKRLELLREVNPALPPVGVLWNPNDPPRRTEYRETEQAAKTLGVQLLSLEVRSPADLAPAFQKAVSERFGVPPSTLCVCLRSGRPNERIIFCRAHQSNDSRVVPDISPFFAEIGFGSDHAIE